MFDEAWWDGEGEGDAIAELQRVLAPLREAPRPWGEVIAQASFVAPMASRATGRKVAVPMAIAAALVVGWIWGRHVSTPAEPRVVAVPIEVPAVTAPLASPTIVHVPVPMPVPVAIEVRVPDEPPVRKNSAARANAPHEALKTLLIDIEERRRPRPSIGDPVQDDDLPDTLTTGDIKIAIDRVKPVVKACGVKHKAKSRVRVNIKLSIAGSTGRPTSVNALGDHDGTPLGQCIADAVAAAQFPRFRKPSLGVVYPFTM